MDYLFFFFHWARLPQLLTFECNTLVYLCILLHSTCWNCVIKCLWTWSNSKRRRWWWWMATVSLFAELSKLRHSFGLLCKRCGCGSYKTKRINLNPLSFIPTGLPISRDLSPHPATDLGFPFRCSSFNPWLPHYSYLNKVTLFNSLLLYFFTLVPTHFFI